MANTKKCKYCGKPLRSQVAGRHERTCAHGPAFTPYLDVKKGTGGKNDQFFCKLCDANWATKVYALRHLDKVHNIGGLTNNSKNTAQKKRGRGKGKKKKDAEPLPMALQITGGPGTADSEIIRKQIVIEIVLDVKTR